MARFRLIVRFFSLFSFCACGENSVTKPPRTLHANRYQLFFTKLIKEKFHEKNNAPIHIKTKTSGESDLKIVTPNDILQEFSVHYEEVAKLMRKYPKVFEIKDTEEEGVHMVMHLGALSPLLEKVNGSQK